MSTRSKPLLRAEEYFASQRAGDKKHEFYQGKVFAMVGASFEHVGVVSIDCPLNSPTSMPT